MLGDTMADSALLSNIADSRCATCESRKSGICCDFDAGFAARFRDKSFHKKYERGTEIFSQGDRTDKIGIIASGLVKIVMITENGEENLIQLLRPGQVVGELNSARSAFSWEAAAQTEICWIARSSLGELLSDQPQVYRAYLASLERRLEEHQLWAAEMRGRNSLQRIAFWLHRANEGLCARRRQILKIDLSRRDLASLLAMTVETLCRGLQQLSERGAIRLLSPDVVEIRDEDRLCAAAGAHPDSGAPITSVAGVRPYAPAIAALNAPAPREKAAGLPRPLGRTASPSRYCENCA